MIRPPPSPHTPGKQGSTSAFPSPLCSTLRPSSFTAACPLSLAFNSRFKSRSSSCCTSPDQYCRREGHRHKAHHSGYSAWSIGVCPVRTCYNDNGRKACCSTCFPHRTATSRNPHILPIGKICVAPSLHFLRRFAICSCTCRKTCSLIIGSCVFSTRTPFTLGLAYPPLVLKGNVCFRMVWPIGFVFHNALDLGYRPCVAFSSGAPALDVCESPVTLEVDKSRRGNLFRNQYSLMILAAPLP